MDMIESYAQVTIVLSVVFSIILFEILVHQAFTLYSAQVVAPATVRHVRMMIYSEVIVHIVVEKDVSIIYLTNLIDKSCYACHESLSLVSYLSNLKFYIE